MFKVIAIIFLAMAATWAVPIEEEHSQSDPSAVPIQPRLAEQSVNKHFTIGPFKTTWFEADRYCKFSGKTLATVMSTDDRDNLEKYLNLYGLERDAMYYIDANNLSGGPYMWKSTGLPVKDITVINANLAIQYGCLTVADDQFYMPYYEVNNCFEANYFICQKIVNA